MHPLLTLLIAIAGAAAAFWIALLLYGLVRKDKKEDRRPGRRKILGLDSFADGGGDGGSD
jgi:hypothetical protein